MLVHAFWGKESGSDQAHHFLASPASHPTPSTASPWLQRNQTLAHQCPSAPSTSACLHAHAPTQEVVHMRMQRLNTQAQPWLLSVRKLVAWFVGVRKGDTHKNIITLSLLCTSPTIGAMGHKSVGAVWHVPYSLGSANRLMLASLHDLPPSREISHRMIILPPPAVEDMVRQANP